MNCWNAKNIKKEIKEVTIENNYCVYIHIFPNNKVYVGLTKQEPYARWGHDGIGYKDQPVYEAITEFSWNNIKHLIIKERLSATEAQELEKELIQKYNSIENGYNVSSGGQAGSFSWVKIPYKGELYSPEELLQFSTVKDLTTHDITTRLSHGWKIEDILTKEKNRKNIKFEYKGNLYSAKELLQFSSVENLTAGDLLNRINSYHWDIERALSQPKNVKKQPLGCRGKDRECLYELDGQRYKTYELLEKSDVSDLTVGNITNRINGSGWSVEDAITKPKKSRNKLFDYNGKLYTSKELAELSPVSNIYSHDITDRIRAGWSINDAVNKPKRKSPTH